MSRILSSLFVVLLLPLAAFAQPDSLMPRVEWIMHPRAVIYPTNLATSDTIGYVWEKGSVNVYDLNSDRLIRSIPVPALKTTDPTLIATPGNNFLFAIENITDPVSTFTRYHDTAIDFQPGMQALYKIDSHTGATIIIDSIASYRRYYYVNPSRTRLIESDGIHFIQIRDLETGRILHTIGKRQLERQLTGSNVFGGFATVEGSYITPDEKFAVVVSEFTLAVFDLSREIELWDTSTSIRSRVSALSLTLDDLLLLSRGDDSIITYDLASGKARTEFHPGLPSKATFLDKDTLIGYNRIWGQNDGSRKRDTLGIYDLTRNTFAPLRMMNAGETSIPRIAGPLVYVNTNRSFLEKTNFRTGAADFFICYFDEISGLVLNSKAQSLIVNSPGYGFTLLDVTTRKWINKWPYYYAVKPCISDDGALAAFVEAGDSVLIWNISEHRQQAAAFASTAPANVAFSHDGNEFAFVCKSGDTYTALIHDNRNGNQISTLGVFAESGQIVYSTNDKEYWISSFDSIRCYNRKSHRFIRAWRFGIDRITDIAVSPHDNWMAVLDNSGSCYLWDLKDAVIRRRIVNKSNSVAIGFSPNDRYFIMSTDSSLQLLDLQSDTVLANVVGMPDRVTAFSISPDDSEIAVGDRKGDIALFRVPASWRSKQSSKAKLRSCVFPLQFYVSRDAAPSTKTAEWPQSDVTFELLDSNHHVIEQFFKDRPLNKARWHIWDYDASKLPKGVYYQRTVIGGVEKLERYERK